MFRLLASLQIVTSPRTGTWVLLTRRELVFFFLCVSNMIAKEKKIVEMGVCWQGWGGYRKQGNECIPCLSPTSTACSTPLQ